MKTRIVRIGNSRGIRIPKPLIEQANLGEEVELIVEGDTLLVRTHSETRAGWAEAANEIASATGSEGIEPALPTKFDEEEWAW